MECLGPDAPIMAEFAERPRHVQRSVSRTVTDTAATKIAQGEGVADIYTGFTVDGTILKSWCI